MGEEGGFRLHTLSRAADEEGEAASASGTDDSVPNTPAPATRDTIAYHDADVKDARTVCDCVMCQCRGRMGRSWDLM